MMNNYQQNPWGQVSLYGIPHGEKNQKWKIVDGKIICNHDDLRLDINMTSGFHGDIGIGANVGCAKRNDAENQQWEIVLQNSNKALESHL